MLTVHWIRLESFDQGERATSLFASSRSVERITTRPCLFFGPPRLGRGEPRGPMAIHESAGD